MQSIKQIQRLNQRELDNSIPSSASWHTDYRDTAYIYIGGIPLDLSEGDIITIFSQYGDPVWIKLARDKETGKSRGFAWLKYEDQRSCDLAVDNLGGATVMGRLLAVDHARYKKRDDENELDGYVGQDRLVEDKPTKGDRSRRERRRSEDESDHEPPRPLIKEEIELAKLLKDQDDEDPMKGYLIEQKKEEVERALKALTKSSDHKRHKDRHHRHRRRTSDDEDRRERHRRRRSDSEDDRRHRSRRDRSRSPKRRDR
ncbi:RNA-binding domain-containing protein [Myriangium duriaei CBS 260.36]|uniref:RNA-binding domain-containing protein n=1 Tax=Myriangium duriaei CBS 260.36 TaxID=1168546 RepID=A0A9P4J5X2_9PEZI|nr:RNA-binding domain-containing protein [Myriangium duriaei CBS 260.36]